jgi:hypothetical protein
LLIWSVVAVATVWRPLASVLHPPGHIEGREDAHE